MENKITAVEWLYDQIIIFPESNDDLAHNARSFEQAKAMEEDQINDAFWNGCSEWNIEKTYYEETYGK